MEIQSIQSTMVGWFERLIGLTKHKAIFYIIFGKTLVKWAEQEKSIARYPS